MEERNNYYKESTITNIQFAPADEINGYLRDAYDTLFYGSEQDKSDLKEIRDAYDKRLNEMRTEYLYADFPEDPIGDGVAEEQQNFLKEYIEALENDIEWKQHFGFYGDDIYKGEYYEPDENPALNAEKQLLQNVKEMQKVMNPDAEIVCEEMEGRVRNASPENLLQVYNHADERLRMIMSEMNQQNDGWGDETGPYMEAERSLSNISDIFDERRDGLKDRLNEIEAHIYEQDVPPDQWNTGENLKAIDDYITLRRAIGGDKMEADIQNAETIREETENYIVNYREKSKEPVPEQAAEPPETEEQKTVNNPKEEISTMPGERNNDITIKNFRRSIANLENASPENLRKRYDDIRRIGWIAEQAENRLNENQYPATITSKNGNTRTVTIEDDQKTVQEAALTQERMNKAFDARVQALEQAYHAARDDGETMPKEDVQKGFEGYQKYLEGYIKLEEEKKDSQQLDVLRAELKTLLDEKSAMLPEEEIKLDPVIKEQAVKTKEPEKEEKKPELYLDQFVGQIGPMKANEMAKEDAEAAKKEQAGIKDTIDAMRHPSEEAMKGNNLFQYHDLLKYTLESHINTAKMNIEAVDKNPKDPLKDAQYKYQQQTRITLAEQAKAELETAFEARAQEIAENGRKAMEALKTAQASEKPFEKMSAEDLDKNIKDVEEYKNLTSAEVDLAKENKAPEGFDIGKGEKDVQEMDSLLGAAKKTKDGRNSQDIAQKINDTINDRKKLLQEAYQLGYESVEKGETPETAARLGQLVAEWNRTGERLDRLHQMEINSLDKTQKAMENKLEEANKENPQRPEQLKTLDREEIKETEDAKTQAVDDRIKDLKKTNEGIESINTIRRQDLQKAENLNKEARDTFFHKSAEHVSVTFRNKLLDRGVNIQEQIDKAREAKEKLMDSFEKRNHKRDLNINAYNLRHHLKPLPEITGFTEEQQMRLDIYDKKVERLENVLGEVQKEFEESRSDSIKALQAMKDEVKDLTHGKYYAENIEKQLSEARNATFDVGQPSEEYYYDYGEEPTRESLDISELDEKIAEFIGEERDGQSGPAMEHKTLDEDSKVAENRAESHNEQLKENGNDVKNIDARNTDDGPVK